MNSPMLKTPTRTHTSHSDPTTSRRVWSNPTAWSPPVALRKGPRPRLSESAWDVCQIEGAGERVSYHERIVLINCALLMWSPTTNPSCLERSLLLTNE